MKVVGHVGMENKRSRRLYAHPKSVTEATIAQCDTINMINQ